MTDEAIESAENEGMSLPTLEETQRMVEEPNGFGTVEQTDSGANHQEMMEMLGGIFIQVSRIYDVLMMALPTSDRRLLSEEHEQGKFVGDVPSMVEDAWKK